MVSSTEKSKSQNDSFPALFKIEEQELPHLTFPWGQELFFSS